MPLKEYPKPPEGHHWQVNRSVIARNCVHVTLIRDAVVGRSSVPSRQLYERVVLAMENSITVAMELILKDRESDLSVQSDIAALCGEYR